MIEWFLQLFCLHKWKIKDVKDGITTVSCIRCGKVFSKETFAR